MAHISREPSPADNATQTEELNIEELYETIVPSKPDRPSIAAYFIKPLDKHKNNLIGLSKNAEIARLSAAKISNDLGQNRFPEYIAHLRRPLAEDHVPGLQEKWDTIYHQFQLQLTEALRDCKLTKSTASTNLASLHGEVLRGFMGDIKAVVAHQLEQDPTNAESIHREEKAILHFWKNQHTTWLDQGKRLGEEEYFKKSSNKRQRDESNQLDRVNNAGPPRKKSNATYPPRPNRGPATRGGKSLRRNPPPSRKAIE